MHLTHKTFPIDARPGPDPQARLFSAIITTDALDRDGEVVLPSGMDKRDFMANPVLLWMHDTDQPIGRVLRLYRQENAWAIEAQIAPRPADFQGEWRPDAVWGLLQAGVLRGLSIGFLPGESRPPSKKDVETYGPTVRRVITRYRLCEVSLVSVPSNQEALVLAVSKGLVSQPHARKLLGMETQAQGDPHESRRILFVDVEPREEKSLDFDQIAEQSLDKLLGRLYTTD